MRPVFAAAPEGMPSADSALASAAFVAALLVFGWLMFACVDAFAWFVVDEDWFPLELDPVGRFCKLWLIEMSWSS